MTEASGASNLLKPDVLKGTSPVLRGGGHGNVFPLTRQAVTSRHATAGPPSQSDFQKNFLFW